MISKILNKKYVIQIKAFSYLHLQSISWYLHVLFRPYSSDDICTLELSFVRQKIIRIFTPNNIYEHYISSMCHCPFEDEKRKGSCKGWNCIKFDIFWTKIALSVIKKLP